jgi:phage shock protein PspC (stress-responsive transcriptional regulator)
MVTYGGKEVRDMVAGKQLRKSNTNRLLFGVCGGLGEYFNVDPLVFRVAFIVLAFVQGLGILLYLLLVFLMPRPVAPAADIPAALKDNLASVPGEATEAGRRVIRLLRGQAVSPPESGEHTEER